MAQIHCIARHMIMKREPARCNNSIHAQTDVTVQTCRDWDCVEHMAPRVVELQVKTRLGAGRVE